MLQQVSILLVDDMHRMVNFVGVYVDMCVLHIPQVLGICVNQGLVLFIVEIAQEWRMQVSKGPRSGVQNGVQK